MYKYIMLGVNTETSQCCLLRCTSPFNEIVDCKLGECDFQHESTNWGGSDNIQRTLQLRQLKETGRKIKLKYGIHFSGCDYDMGHEENWYFTVNEIWELGRI